MNWKNTLRKAPFRVSDEQEAGREQKLERKKELLNRLQALLEKFVDDPLSRLIRQKPDERAYTVKVSMFFSELQTLITLGLTNLDVEKHLAEEYDVEDVMLDYGDKTITLEK